MEDCVSEIKVGTVVWVNVAWYKYIGPATIIRTVKDSAYLYDVRIPCFRKQRILAIKTSEIKYVI